MHNMSQQSKCPTFFVLMGLALLALTGCATTQLNSSTSPKPNKQAVWAVLPLINNTATPYAGERVQRQLAALLGAKEVKHVLIAPAAANQGLLPIGNGTQNQTRARAWARRHGARYTLDGSVDEWRYMIGLDGQPVVGFTLYLRNLQSGKVIWRGVASASGNSREGSAVLSQRVLMQLLGRLLP